MGRLLIFKLACIATLLSTMSWAQEARGSISGRVTDTSGAVVPGAQVTVTNTATNETRRLTTNETGYYEANFLDPSTYAVGVEAQGFKKFRRTGLELNVGARIDIPVSLEVGGVTETVEVSAEAPLLETTTASGGRVLDQRQLVNLPFSDLNPFALSALAPGMQWTGQPEYRRPFDNGGTSAFNTAGGVGQNEYSMDGVSVTGTGRRVGFTPPADSITEFKLETSNFDASQGFTSGATINVVSRSGTNQLHGSLFNQHWQQRWNATPHFTRLLWESQVASGKITPSTQKQATGRSNNYGFSASGPVWIPKIFDGRNKLFWTITWNGIKQSKAETTDAINRSVPTLAERTGDFSEKLTIANGPALYTIYDPASARQSGTNVVRTPFSGNIIPRSRIVNPMYNSIIKLFPTPNNVPGLVNPNGINNYLAVAMPKNENFNSIVNRYDYALGDKHRLNARWQWNDRLADEYDWTYETARGMHSNGLTRINRGGAAGWLWTMNSTNVLDFSVGISRFEEGSRNTVRSSFKAADFGLPAYIDQKAGSYTQLPRLDFNDITDIGDSYAVIGGKATTYQAQLSMTTIKGNHSWKYGWQERRMDFAALGPGNSTGLFQFRNTYVRRADNDNVSSNHGLDFASFLLGAPNSMSIDTNDSAYLRTPRRAFYFQDDWRLSSKFRLSLGLRYERENGGTERYNRALVASFFPDLKLPFTDAVQAAYAANPRPELSAANFKVLGGTRYLGMDGYDTLTKGVNWWLPKVGVVYNINSKTVIRTGWGMYADTYNINNNRPSNIGYNLPTSTVLTNDNGLSFCCGVGAAANLGAQIMSNPFPERAGAGRFDVPLQNALGYIAHAGRNWNSGDYALVFDYMPAIQHRWRFGIQRELAHNLMIDLAYNGAYAKLPMMYRIDALPSQFWATGSVRNQAQDDLLNTNVANPFNIRNLSSIQSSNPTLYQYLTTQGLFTGSNIRLHQLLRPSGFEGTTLGIRQGDNFDDKRGYMKYHDMSMLVERRFTRGLQTMFMYTWASSYAANFAANEFDTMPSEQINNNIRPHRIAWSGTYEMPWGKNRQWLKGGVLAYLVGNWNAGWVYQYQNGPATTWSGTGNSGTTISNNRFFYGDINNIADLLKHDSVHSGDIHKWFDSSVAYRTAGACGVPSGFTGFDGRSACQPGSYHVRMFPTLLDAIREDGISNVDFKIERIFPIKAERGINARFSVDLLNALNHTNFAGPNTDPTNPQFGNVTTQRGLSRVIQFNLRVEF